MLDIISYNKALSALRKAGFVGTKDVDETNLEDENVIYYSEEIDKYITKELKIKVKEWRPNTEYDKNEIIVYDDMMHWVLVDHISHESSIDFDLIGDKIIPLATEAGLGNILALEYEYNEDKTQVELIWTNPTSESYEGRTVFIGKNVDIMGYDYEECLRLSNQELSLYSNVEKNVEVISEGLGTDVGNEDSVSFSIDDRNRYYIKIFAMHGTEMGVSPATGRYTVIEVPDVTPPIATTDLQGIVEDNKVKLTWTQPTDDDFFYTKVVKSKSGFPETPEDGEVLDTVSGEGVYVDDNIVKGIVYFYNVFFFDDSGDGYEYGKEGNWSESNPIEIIDVPVYGFDVNIGERTRDAVGLNQEDFDMHYPWSDMARAVVDGSGEIVYYLDDYDSSLQEDGVTLADLTGSDGNVVVVIPEFYYSYSNGEVLIGHEEFEGSKKFNKSLIGAFEASVNDVSELQSVINRTPVLDKAITEYRSMTENMGAGWSQRDFEMLNVIKYLFILEYGSLNSQQLIGEGIVNSNEPIPTGSTLELGNKSGVSSNGAISYRGIENAWGNVWEFVEGLYVTDVAYYSSESDYDTFISDDNIGSYKSTGVVPITQDGFMSSIDDELMVGNEMLGDNVSFTGDYQYSHKSGNTNIAVHGGNFEDGDKAGMFRLHFGLTPFGKEEEMGLVVSEETHSIYEKEITETELEAIKNIVVG